MNKSKVKNVSAGLGLGSVIAVLYGIDPVRFSENFNLALQHQVSQYVIAFSVAAWIHSGRVKKEFQNVTFAITGLGDALRSDLSALGSRIGLVEEKIQSLEKGKQNEP